MPANRTAAFSAVAAEGVSRSDYRSDLHERVDGYVAEWEAFAVGSPEAVDEPAYRRELIRDCKRYVKNRHRQEYGNPILAWLAWMGVRAIVSYLVERTLRELFGKAGSAE
jgi:hypothetical protein